ncbi:hypothetical protein OLMES_5374 [Oleiphilus messinensis]|uniref:Lipoprotein n=2 Tax=Oleiphilus messinensis TaxID=141451 RepID=A0A1Y0IIY6_9GAMM|nr:hypothetical protein OLMES_5374 [Oleiphilus messinensis]
MNWFFRILLLGTTAVSGCAHICNTQYDTEQKKFITFIAAEEAFAKKLNDSFQKEEETSGIPHKIISVSGAAYGIGSVVDFNNYENLATICDLNGLEVVHSSFGQTWPDRDSELTATIELDSGELTKKFGDLVIGIGLDYSNPATYRYLDLQQKLIPSLDLEERLRSADCYERLQGHKVLLIKGVISGKKEISVGKNFETGANVKTHNTSLFKFQYIDKDNFRRIDKEAKQLYMIATLIDGTSFQSAETEDSSGVNQTFKEPTNTDIDTFLRKKERDITWIMSPSPNNNGTYWFKSSTGDYLHCPTGGTLMTYGQGGDWIVDQLPDGQVKIRCYRNQRDTQLWLHRPEGRPSVLLYDTDNNDTVIGNKWFLLDTNDNQIQSTNEPISIRIMSWKGDYLPRSLINSSRQ